MTKESNQQITPEEIYQNEIKRLGLPDGATWDEIEKARDIVFEKKSEVIGEQMKKWKERETKYEKWRKEKSKILGLDYENAPYEEQKKVDFMVSCTERAEDLGLHENATYKEIADADFNNTPKFRKPFIRKLTEYLELPQTANWEEIENELKKRGLEKL